MATKATTAKPVDKPVIKAERKKPVRKSPALKDFPNRLAWLKALTTYEESVASVADITKVARLDKRMDAKQKAINKLTKELAALITERAVLSGDEVPETTPDEQAIGT